MKIGYVIALFVMLIAGCGNNSYDGVNGLQSNSTTNSSELEQLQESVLQAHSKAALEALDDLNVSLHKSSLSDTRSAFVSFIKAWKKVQATYIAGSFESTLLDEANYIDFFHVGNEDIAAQLDSVFDSNLSTSTQMYKYSMKSINALEYILYAPDKSDSRRFEMADVAVKELRVHIENVDNFYQTNVIFTSSLESSTEELINVLIDSSYKLKEWRVGEAAGFTVKYEGDPDSSRLEYVLSEHSLLAIEAILIVHQEVMDNGLKAISDQGGASEEAAAIMTTISEALATCQSYEHVLADELESEKTQTLYNQLDALHEGYYEHLIGTLNLTPKIIEADGD